MASSLNGTGVTFSNGQTQSVSSIGDDGQSWQDVTGSRAINTTYTNTTGRPIQVSICVTNSTASSAVLDLLVDGVLVYTNLGRTTYYNFFQIAAIIPAGSTYATQSATGMTGWAELR